MNKPDTNGIAFKTVLALIGLIVGFGFAGAIGHYQYKELDAKIERVSGKLERKIDGVNGTVSNLAESVARIEGHLSIERR